MKNLILLMALSLLACGCTKKVVEPDCDEKCKIERQKEMHKRLIM